MRYREEPAPWDDGEYNTGYTTPPKSHRTFIALLLIAVIILIGLSTLLGVSNLRLFQQLNQQKAEPTICYSTAESVVDSEFVPIDVEQTANESIGFPALAEQEDTLTLREIYIKCSPSVVSITSESRSGNSSGSGVIFSEDGYVVTNYHVIENGESYTVLLADERSQPARLVGSDPTSDLAVLQVNATDLTPAEFGDSDDVYVGDGVVAIGDPLGVEFRGTMTNGIVSAINRNVNVNGRTMNLIAEEDDMLEEMASDLVKRHMAWTEALPDRPPAYEEGGVLAPELGTQPVPLQRRAAVQVLQAMLGPDARVETASVDAVLAAWDEPGTPQAAPHGGYVANIQGNLAISANKRGVRLEPMAAFRVRRRK